MFVQKIEISGFKSFAKKTVLDFCGGEVSRKSGITCVVGPNGSGKSNVSDALRWVIGEKSVKNLRGSKKEDVIFAGSKTKSKLGCAQVSVFFDNSEKRFDIDYEQVVVTRKVFRDGENSYYVNNSRVRLFDLVTLLSKAGIGHGNYTIVNQGMTDKILLSSPVERMSYLEDAAGVKEFQLKKTKSVRRMKTTKRNLEKAESLMREIMPELRVLKRQSKKIEKSRETREKLAKKRKDYFAVKLGGVEERAKKNDLELEKIEKQMSISGALIKKIKKELTENKSGNFESQKDEIIKIEKEKKELEEKRYKLERLDFKKEIEFKSLQEKIEQLGKEKIVLVDKKYILSKLGKLKEIIDSLSGKPVTAELVDEISNLVKEVEAGKAVKNKISKEVEAKKKEMLVGLKKIEDEGKTNLSELKNCRTEISNKEKEIREINEKARKQQEAQVELKDKLRREEFEAEKAGRYLSHLKAESEKLEIELKEVLKDISDNFVGKIEDLKKVSCSVNLEDLKMQIEKLNWQLEQVKEIDVSVVEQYGEMQEKYDFLKKETKDLKETLVDLSEVIATMEKTIKKKMKEAFEEINKEFSVYFKQIFSGGSARLEKIKIDLPASRKNSLESDEEEVEEVDEKEKFEYGLDIKVNPPGKRINSLGMLSGGERTLTSIALLFALISYNPPPFAFLDEIEANLDESNAERFSKILKKLSGKTQFILATHSREVMRIADILYGITMDKGGYSKVFSVELGQIKEDSQIV